MKYCTKCNKQFNTAGNFCPQCGNQLTEAAATFCPKCGKKLAAGVRFCDGCGASINGNVPDGVAAQNNTVYAGTPNQKKSKLLLVGVLVLIIALLGGAGFYFTKRYDKSVSELVAEKFELTEYRNKIVGLIPDPVLNVLGIEKNVEEPVKQESNGNGLAGTTTGNDNNMQPNQGQAGNVTPNVLVNQPTPASPAPPQVPPATVPPVNNPAPAVPPVSTSAISNAYHSSADQEGNYLHSALLTIDGNPSTCWSEGVPGLGIGENIVIHFNGTYKVSGMNIWIGHQKSESLFYQNARPRSVRVMGSDGSSEVYFLSDTFGVQRVNFRRPINTSLVKIVVDQVMPGNKYEDTCIAEVSFF